MFESATAEFFDRSRKCVWYPLNSQVFWLVAMRLHHGAAITSRFFTDWREPRSGRTVAEPGLGCSPSSSCWAGSEQGFWISSGWFPSGFSTSEVSVCGGSEVCWNSSGWFPSRFSISGVSAWACAGSEVCWNSSGWFPSCFSISGVSAWACGGSEVCWNSSGWFPLRFSISGVSAWACGGSKVCWNSGWFPSRFSISGVSAWACGGSKVCWNSGWFPSGFCISEVSSVCVLACRQPNGSCSSMFGKTKFASREQSDLGELTGDFLILFMTSNAFAAVSAENKEEAEVVNHLCKPFCVGLWCLLLSAPCAPSFWSELCVGSAW